MTILNVFSNILTELNKVQAPALLLDDFIYFFNKGIQEYENERYNLYETKQQLTDDLRVLVKSAELSVSLQTGAVYGTSYKCVLPDDYVHILNCVCEFEDKNPRCSGDSTVFQGANKLTTNQRSHIIDNYYLKPSADNPYYYIINVDDPSANVHGSKTDDEKKAGGNVRYGNSMQPVMQILCGDPKRYVLKKVYIDYLRAPKFYSLSQDQIDAVVDTTDVLEFPDYVIYEIINKIVALVMENGSNPRIQSHPSINQSIA